MWIGKCRYSSAHQYTPRWCDVWKAIYFELKSSPPDESIHLNRERCWHFYHSHVSRELWLSSLLTYFNTRWLLLILYFLDDFTAYPFRPHMRRPWTLSGIGLAGNAYEAVLCLPFYGFYPNFCLKSDTHTHTHTRNFRLRNSLKQRHFSQFWFSKSYRII